jgi:hypothetical protein
VVVLGVESYLKRGGKQERTEKELLVFNCQIHKSVILGDPPRGCESVRAGEESIQGLPYPTVASLKIIKTNALTNKHKNRMRKII